MQLNPADYNRTVTILAEMAEIRAEQRCMIREAKRARTQLKTGRPNGTILDWLFRRTTKQTKA